MQAQWNNHLRNQFRKLQREFSQDTANCRLLSGGGHGLTVDHGDGSISKYLFRDGNIYQDERALKLFYREIATLDFLGRNPVEGIQIPVLIGEPDHLYSPNFVARYRMTRIAGRHESPDPDKPQSYNQILHESMGSLLAKFHKAAANMPFASVIDESHHFKIVPVVRARKEMNDALGKANAYLAAHPLPGVIHGDYRYNNILVQDGIATGLIDFSFAGKISFIQQDFYYFTKEKYSEDFFRGYKKETGIDIPPYTSDLFDLVLATRDLNHGEGFSSYAPANQTQNWVTVNTALNNLIPITGFKP